MTGISGKLVSCLLLLALAGTVSGAGFVATKSTGFAGTGNTFGAEPLRVGGSPGALLQNTNPLFPGEHCSLPIWKLPAYYVCVMVCKLGGGGDACPGRCERALRECS